MQKKSTGRGQIGFGFVPLSPVLPTASHPEFLSGMGWTEFARLIERSPLPVFALGGMKKQRCSIAPGNTAHYGIALMRGWFNRLT